MDQVSNRIQAVEQWPQCPDGNVDLQGKPGERRNYRGRRTRGCFARTTVSPKYKDHRRRFRNALNYHGSVHGAPESINLQMAEPQIRDPQKKLETYTTTIGGYGPSDV